MMGAPPSVAGAPKLSVKLVKVLALSITAIVGVPGASVATSRISSLMVRPVPRTLTALIRNLKLRPSLPG